MTASEMIDRLLVRRDARPCFGGRGVVVQLDHNTGLPWGAKIRVSVEAAQHVHVSVTIQAHTGHVRVRRGRRGWCWVRFRNR